MDQLPIKPGKRVNPNNEADVANKKAKRNPNVKQVLQEHIATEKDTLSLLKAGIVCMFLGQAFIYLIGIASLILQGPDVLSRFHGLDHG